MSDRQLLLRPHMAKVFALVGGVAVLSGLVGVLSLTRLSEVAPNNSIPARGAIGGLGVCLGSLVLLPVIWRANSGEALIVGEEDIRYTCRKAMHLSYSSGRVLPNSK